MSTPQQDYQYNPDATIPIKQNLTRYSEHQYNIVTGKTKKVGVTTDYIKALITHNSLNKDAATYGYVYYLKEITSQYIRLRKQKPLPP